MTFFELDRDSAVRGISQLSHACSPLANVCVSTTAESRTKTHEAALGADENYDTIGTFSHLSATNKFALLSHQLRQCGDPDSLESR
jgi:hypothetical protein